MALFILCFIILIGALTYPALTLGVILTHYGHPVLGGLVIASFLIYKAIASQEE